MKGRKEEEEEKTTYANEKIEWMRRERRGNAYDRMEEREKKKKQNWRVAAEEKETLFLWPLRSVMADVALVGDLRQEISFPIPINV